MWQHPDQFAEFARLFVEVITTGLAILFGILRKYHANQKRKVEAESSTKDNKIRELEITVLMKKKELEELRTEFDKLKTQYEEETEAKEKIESRLKKLREALKNSGDLHE